MLTWAMMDPRSRGASNQTAANQYNLMNQLKNGPVQAGDGLHRPPATVALKDPEVDRRHSDFISGAHAKSTPSPSAQSSQLKSTQEGEKGTSVWVCCSKVDHSKHHALTLMHPLPKWQSKELRGETLKAKLKAEEGAMTKEERREMTRKRTLYRKQKKWREEGKQLSDREQLELASLLESTRKSLERARQQLKGSSGADPHASTPSNSGGETSDVSPLSPDTLALINTNVGTDLFNDIPSAQPGPASAQSPQPTRSRKPSQRTASEVCMHSFT